MRHHVMVMSYLPKSHAVRDGVCTQTIRRGEKYWVGDELTIGGTGRYVWEWKISAVVTEVYNITVCPTGFRDHEGMFHSWDSGIADYLAERNHIQPATGIELYNVLKRRFYATRSRDAFQVVRWDVLHDQV